MKNRSEIKENLCYIFDGILVIILAVIYILELTKVIKVGFKNELVFDLILILLPSIVTIVSISLSLTKEKLYGVTISEFTKLRRTKYSFIHMVIVMSLSIALYTVFCLTPSVVLTILILDAFDFIYSLLFSIQEIPLLVQDKRTLKRIIRDSYENRNKSEDFFEQRGESILFRVIQNMVLTEGIKSSYNMLKHTKGNDVTSYNSNLFDVLLSFQNKYYWDASEDLEVLSSNLSGEYKNIEIINAINRGYWNVEDLLSDDPDINYSNDFSDDKTYHLTRSIFVLHRICDNLKLYDKEKEKIKDIIHGGLLSKFSCDKYDKRFLSFVTSMSILSLKDGDIWFIKNLRDNNLYPSAIFSFDNCKLGLFISIFIAHILDKKLVPSDSIESIEFFLNEPTCGLNHDGSSWNMLLARMMEHSNPKDVAHSLIELLDIYDSISKYQYWFDNQGFISDASNNFEKRNIIDAWLEIILFGDCFYITKENVEDVINLLDADTKRILIDVLSKKWILDDKLCTTCKLRFLNYFSKENIIVSENYTNKPIIEYLASFRSEYYKRDLKEKINNDEADVVDMKNKIKSTFDDCIKGSSFYDRAIDLAKENKLYFTWRLEKGDLQSYFKAYLRQLPNSINLIFRKQIEKRIKPLYINNHELSEEQIDKIRKLTPAGRSAISGVYNRTDELQKMIDGIPAVNENMVLPLNFFFKSDAIRLNAEYDEDTTIRPLKDEEIDYIIDQDYQMVNGLYRYSEFTNDTTRSFLVTREELKEILKSKIQYAFIVFKVKIIIDNKKCLWFDRKKKD